VDDPAVRGRSARSSACCWSPPSSGAPTGRRPAGHGRHGPRAARSRPVAL